MLSFLLTQLHILLAHKIFALISALLIILALGTHGEGEKAEVELSRAAREAAPEAARAFGRDLDLIITAESKYPGTQEELRRLRKLLIPEDEMASGGKIIAPLRSGPELGLDANPGIRHWIDSGMGQGSRLGFSPRSMSEILETPPKTLYGPDDRPILKPEVPSKKPLEITNCKARWEYSGDRIVVKQDVNVCAAVVAEELWRHNRQQAKSSQEVPPEEHQRSRQTKETSVATLRSSDDLDLSAMCGLAEQAQARAARAATGPHRRSAN